MSKGVYVFTYKNNEIHTRFIEGEYWFVATDIVRAVGASAKNTTQIIRKLPESSRMLYLHEIPTRPNGINTWHIDEQGLRLLLDWPTKPEAAILLDYIESEILSVLPMLHAKAEKEELEAAPSVAKPSENVPMVIPKEEPKEVQEEIRIFESPLFGKIRTVDIDEKIYFVASDVAKSLGYARPNDAISVHCRYTVKRRIPHPQSKCSSIEVNVIPEGDIYRLVAHSELPSAQAFESWVFDEVLPTIRKHGIYMTPKVAEEAIEDQESFLARAVLVAQGVIDKQKAKIAEQAETIATLEPKAKIYDKVMNTESTCTVSDVAISNGWQSSALFKLLRTNGWLDKRSNAKHHVSRKAPKGVFKVIKGIYGEQIRVTQEGYKQITALIKENE